MKQHAPLKPLSVISVPFSHDFVGPLPRTKRGNKYLLTSMCLGSKHLEAVPLKRVDVQSVAETMMARF